MAITEKTPAVAAPVADSPKVKERIDALQAKLDAALVAANEATGLRAQLASQAKELALQRFVHQHNLSADAMDPEVIEDISRRFDRRVATMGADKAGTFDEYLSVVKEAPPVTLRSVFVPREVATPAATPEGAPPPAVTPAAAPAPKPVPGSVNGGIVPRSGPPPAAGFTDAVLATMTPSELLANRAAIRAEAIAAGEIVA